jgi:hypothetical protein
MKKIIIICLTIIVPILFFVYSTNSENIEFSEDGTRVITVEPDKSCIDEKGREIWTDFKGSCEEFFANEKAEAIKAAKTYGIYVEEYMDEQKCIITLGVYKEKPVGHVLATYKSRKAGDITNCDVGIKLLTYEKRIQVGEKMMGLNNSFYFFSDQEVCDIFIEDKKYTGNNIDECTKLGRKLYAFIK